MSLEADPEGGDFEIVTYNDSSDEKQTTGVVGDNSHAHSTAMVGSDVDDNSHAHLTEAVESLVVETVGGDAGSSDFVDSNVTREHSTKAIESLVVETVGGDADRDGSSDFVVDIPDGSNDTMFVPFAEEFDNLMWTQACHDLFNKIRYSNDTVRPLAHHVASLAGIYFPVLAPKDVMKKLRARVQAWGLLRPMTMTEARNYIFPDMALLSECGSDPVWSRLLDEFVGVSDRLDLCFSINRAEDDRCKLEKVYAIVATIRRYLGLPRKSYSSEELAIVMLRFQSHMCHPPTKENASEKLFEE